MKNLVRNRLSLIAVAVLLAAVPSTSIATVHSSSSAAQSAAPVFRPLLPKLAPSHVPVYLPSWLPRFPVRVYPVGGVTDHGNGYFAYLATRQTGWADADLLFTFDGAVGPPDNYGRKVVLPGRISAFLDPHTGGNMGTTISWAVGRYSYTIGRLPTQAKLIRAARSVLRIQPSRMPADPVSAVEMLINSPANPSACYPHDYRQWYLVSHGCPVTKRLQRRLRTHPTTGPGGGADPICRCQNYARMHYHLDRNNGSLALVTARWAFQSPLRITFIVIHAPDGWHVNDTYCAGRPSSSIYKTPVSYC